MHHKDYIVVKDRHPRISEVLNDCVNLCVPACKNEPLSSILQKICGKLTEAISDIAAVEAEVDELQADVCPPISEDTGNAIECRDDGIFVEIPPDVLSRFGVTGEDDTGNEDRTFTAGPAYSFNVVVGNEMTLTSSVGSLVLGASGLHLIDSSATGRYYLHTLDATPKANILYYDSTSFQVTRGPVSDLVVTANNGLTKTANNIALGGTLTTFTGIATGSFALQVSGTNSGVTGVLSGTNSSSGSGVLAVSNSGNGIQAQSTSGSAIFSSSTTGLGAYLSVNPSSTNTAVNVARVERLTSGTAADGIGGIFEFRTETSNTSAQISTQLISSWTTAAVASRTSKFTIAGVLSTVSQDLMTLQGGGAIVFPQGLQNFADDTAAAGGGIAINQLYRTGSSVSIRVT